MAASSVLTQPHPEFRASLTLAKIADSRTRERKDQKQTIHTRAPACSRAAIGHISEVMAGSPLKRQRKLGIRGNDGRIIAFP